jgi:hypothetical protein
MIEESRHQSFDGPATYHDLFERLLKLSTVHWKAASLAMASL